MKPIYILFMLSILAACIKTPETNVVDNCFEVVIQIPCGDENKYSWLFYDAAKKKWAGKVLGKSINPVAGDVLFFYSDGRLGVQTHYTVGDSVSAITSVFENFRHWENGVIINISSSGRYLFEWVDINPYGAKKATKYRLWVDASDVERYIWGKR